MQNVMTGFYANQDTSSASALRTALVAADLPVPDELDTALRSLAWTVEVPAEPTTEALFAATTEKAYQDAATKYAEALDARERMSAVRDVAREVRTSVVQAALRAARPVAGAAAIDRFNAVAGDFVEAVRSFPDVDITTLTTDQFSAFAKAREVADTLRRVQAVYTAVYGPASTNGTAGDVAWSRVAGLDDRDHLRAVYEADQRHRAGGMAPLAPFYAIVRNGADLRLVTPNEAKTAHEEAGQRQDEKDEANRPAHVPHPREAGVSPGVVAAGRMRGLPLG